MLESVLFVRCVRVILYRVTPPGIQGSAKGELDQQGSIDPLSQICYELQLGEFVLGITVVYIYALNHKGFAAS